MSEIDVAIRALEQGDGPIIVKYHHQIRNWLEELKRRTDGEEQQSKRHTGTCAKDPGAAE